MHFDVAVSVLLLQYFDSNETQRKKLDRLYTWLLSDMLKCICRTFSETEKNLWKIKMTMIVTEDGTFRIVSKPLEKRVGKQVI